MAEAALRAATAAAARVGLPAAVVAGLLLTVLVLVLGGGAPQAGERTVPWIVPVLDWVLALLPLLDTLLGALTVGFALFATASFERVLPAPLRARTAVHARTAAWSWAVLSAVTVFVLALRTNVLVPDASLEGLLGPSQTEATLAGGVLAAGVALLVRAAPGPALLLAVGALGTPLLTGHAHSGHLPSLATTTLLAHVAAACLWSGGLLVLAWVALSHPDAWLAALPRYSAVALGCVVALVASGTAVAVTGLGSPGEVVSTSYGMAVVAKAVGLLLLVGLGCWQRARVVRRAAGSRRVFCVLAGAELTLMVLVFAVATALAQTPPP